MLMMICFIFLGVFVGAVCSLLYVNFDTSLKKIVLSVINLGGSGGILYFYHRYYGITEQAQKLSTTTAFIIAFIASFCVCMRIICWLIKDKDDTDVIRIRDILLGQKDYIKQYYESRKKQIDTKLHIPFLEERERNVSIREAAVEREENRIAEARETLEKIGRKKLYLSLPDRKKIYLKQEFINEMPSFFDSFSNCINGIEGYSVNEIERIKNNGEVVTQKSFTAFLTNIELNILTSVFGNSSQIRIHFRYYNPESNCYELLVAICGKQKEPEIVSKMTPIPYEDSMIEKSFTCRRAVIKSLNAGATKYDGNNRSVWRDYMTFAFYNITTPSHDGKAVPVLTFGISVKNEDRYKDLFRFLNFAKIEDYLNANIERYNEIVPISQILYSSN